MEVYEIGGESVNFYIFIEDYLHSINNKIWPLRSCM